ncbi:MAG: hypothetical protein COU33_04985 [Candidatus Magasanikbacteria bacterium CG10_big_fil_rev_8_21_14_0_10_43_6]|uniref:DUF192 domain-containing protein n=1 Tax=Candidatus Magasanikbacteria bacterium CG10_big_fil_rev_8_21_14_0_10_43_6 TaxID=1974650 RepID=A0A2M6VZY9_9BACT|nr:MAG: hypothetical protein COU33_04985 [Candidatus Magasanikbacteria bacterium CG10_big_fil_rev_8_21_14_0_10_43_6]
MLWHRQKEPDDGQQTKKISTGYAIFLVFFVICLVFLKAWQYYWPKAVVSVGSVEEVSVLVAKTPWHWHRGLGKRESLKEYDGMIFLFPVSRRHGIVMRDMKFGIDIIWFSGNVVVDIAPFVPVEDVPEEELHVYLPRDNADMVLEVPAGWVNEHGIAIGDELHVVRE